MRVTVLFFSLTSPLCRYPCAVPAQRPAALMASLSGFPLPSALNISSCLMCTTHTILLYCSFERSFACTVWTHACPRALAAVLSPQCPRCPYSIKGQGPCSVAMQSTWDDHRALAYGIIGLLGVSQHV